MKLGKPAIALDHFRWAYALSVTARKRLYHKYLRTALSQITEASYNIYFHPGTLRPIHPETIVRMKKSLETAVGDIQIEGYFCLYPEKEKNTYFRLVGEAERRALLIREALKKLGLKTPLPPVITGFSNEPGKCKIIVRVLKKTE